MWAEKKKRAWYTLFAHAWFPHDFWKIYSVTLTSARHDFYCMKDACHLACSVWTATKEQKRYSALHLQKLFMHSSIPAKCLQQATGTIFLKFTDRLYRTKQCRPLLSSLYCFLLQNCSYVSCREYNSAVRPFSR